MRTNNCVQKFQKGFTLVELMVSLSIFSIVMVISTGTLLIMIDINAKAQALYTSTTNLSFALDTMTREMRMGYHYYCKVITDPGNTENNNGADGIEGNDLLPRDSTTADCTTVGNFVAFTSERTGTRIGYRYNPEEHSIEYATEGDRNWTRLTSPDVYIEKFEVDIEGSKPYFDDDYEENPGGKTQPVTNMLIKGYVNNGLEQNTDFNIQTRIIQRRLDLI